MSDGAVAIQADPPHLYGAFRASRGAVPFANTRVRLNQGAASTEHVKAGVRANRSTKAASRATSLPHNRSPSVRNLHPLSPSARQLGRRSLQGRYTTLCVGKQSETTISETTASETTTPETTTPETTVGGAAGYHCAISISENAGHTNQAERHRNPLCHESGLLFHYGRCRATCGLFRQRRRNVPAARYLAGGGAATVMP
jgi:hypothetical protein